MRLIAILLWGSLATSLQGSSRNNRFNSKFLGSHLGDYVVLLRKPYSSPSAGFLEANPFLPEDISITEHQKSKDLSGESSLSEQLDNVGDSLLLDNQKDSQNFEEIESSGKYEYFSSVSEKYPDTSFGSGSDEDEGSGRSNLENPDKIGREQVGEGFRFIFPEENPSDNWIHSEQQVLVNENGLPDGCASTLKKVMVTIDGKN